MRASILPVVVGDRGAVSVQIHESLAHTRMAKGRAAAAALTSAIERGRDGTSGRARHVRLPTELVVRDSTAAPPTRVR